MELDDLKGVWQQQARKAEGKLLTKQELLAMVRDKAKDPIHSLRRSVLFEFWFTVVFVVACTTFGFASSDRLMGDISFVAALLSCGFGLFYYRKLSLLNALKIESLPLSENLANLITKFEKFLRIYRWGYTILVPISLMVGAIAGIKVSTGKDLSQLVSQPILWAVLIVATVPMAFIMHWGMKLYLKKLYGNHLSRLQSLLRELQN